MSFKIERHKELTQVSTHQDTALGIMRWGLDNSFPQTLINLINQSPTAKPAASRTAKFYKGSKFIGEDTIVSSTGVTLKQVIDIMADDYSIFEAFVLVLNYNVDGKVVGINPMRITDFRFNEFDELNFASKVGYFSNYGRNDEVQKTMDMTATKGKIKWFDRFNPEVVLSQIKNTKGGLGNFTGQALYHSASGHSAYPIPVLQAPINYVLSDVENSILVRKETSTGFINSYLLKTSMPADDARLAALEEAIESAQGARGSGKVITMSDLDPEALSNTVLEEIGGGGASSKAIIDSAAAAYELTQKIINGAYQIPPVIAGADQKNGFSGTDLEDAYYVFGAITKGGRDTIEQQINRVLSNSVFDVQSIKLEPLKLDKQEEEVEDPEEEVVSALEEFVEAHAKEGKAPTISELMEVINLFKKKKDV